MAASAPEACTDRTIDRMERSPESALIVPDPGAFPAYPQSWYAVCQSSSLAAGQVTRLQLCGRAIALFRTRDGEVGALQARCPHFGSDLSAGRVVDGDIECPYHRFRFDRAGTCRGQGLRANAYPVAERYGTVFVFLGARPLFALPTFGETAELVSSPPMHWHLNTQWYIVGANAFDGRHFAHAHDRPLVGPPEITVQDQFSLGVRYQFDIMGTGLLEHATRLISGRRVQFDVLACGGNLILVQASFARDKSFGVVSVAPTFDTDTQAAHLTHRVPQRTAVTVVVNAERRGKGAGSYLVAWMRARLKRIAIGAMLRQDSDALKGLDYHGEGLLPGDEALATFLRWAADLPSGEGRPSGERKLQGNHS